MPESKYRWRPVHWIMLVLAVTIPITFIMAFVARYIGDPLDVEHSEIAAAALGSILGVLATGIGHELRKP